MNESLGKVEIDDVLTSLKQLIADKDDNDVGLIETERNEKLLLGPALRVVEGRKLERAQQAPVSRNLEAKISKLEEMIARSEGPWEPDSAGQDDYACKQVTGFPWEQVVDAALGEFDAPAALRAVQTKSETPLRSAETESLNSEKLRETVTEIIREELRGTLGEKITQNIRQMVQREIQSVLKSGKLRG